MQNQIIIYINKQYLRYTKSSHNGHLIVIVTDVLRINCSSQARIESVGSNLNVFE